MMRDASSFSEITRRAMIQTVSRVHEFWYRVTDGMIGSSWMGRRMLLLTTKGRKSGKERTTPLLCIEDGDNLVVIASYGGSDRDPDWWLNLKSNPEAQVQMGSRKMTVRGEKASAEEKRRLWPVIVETYAAYDDYQRRTRRDIPVVVLRPLDRPS